MTKWYNTPKKLAKVDETKNDKCWECKVQVGSFYHLWWGCNYAKRYWAEIHREIQKILKYDLLMSPELYLLGLRMFEIDKKDRVSLWYMITAVRQLYMKNWKTVKIPTIDEWRQLILKYAELDKLTKKLDGKTNKDYLQDWEKIKLYFKSTENFGSHTKNFEIY